MVHNNNNNKYENPKRMVWFFALAGDACSHFHSTAIQPTVPNAYCSRTKVCWFAEWHGKATTSLITTCDLISYGSAVSYPGATSFFPHYISKSNLSKCMHVNGRARCGVSMFVYGDARPLGSACVCVRVWFFLYPEPNVSRLAGFIFFNAVHQILFDSMCVHKLIVNA